MKKTITSSIAFMIFALVSGIIISTTGCGNNKPKIQKDTPFSFVPYECKVIGEVNVTSILKIEGISKHIDDNKDLPYMKEVKSAGLDISNIQSIVFGIEMNVSLKNATPATPQTSDGVIIVSAKTKVNVAEFIKIAEQNNEGTKFKVNKIEDKTAYILPAIGNNAETYIVQLNDKLIAIGTQKDVVKTVSLINNKGKSILEDDEVMKLSKNTDMTDMLWVATVIPDELVSNADKNTPNIKDGIITVNYLNDCLKIGGIINCATKEGAQKILMPFQMASSLIVMSANNTVKPEDISIKADNTALSLDISLTKNALKVLLTENNNKQQKQTQKTADLSKEDILAAPQQLPTAEAIIGTNDTSRK